MAGLDPRTVCNKTYPMLYMQFSVSKINELPGDLGQSGGLLRQLVDFSQIRASPDHTVGISAE